MNRPFKFRAWDKQAKAWLLPVALATNLGDWFVFNPEVPDAIDVEIMQFTGLTDKNGKEIYEGDIVTYGEETKPQEVRYSSASFFPFDESDYGWTEYNAGIIGNIYENSDLLV